MGKSRTVPLVGDGENSLLRVINDGMDFPLFGKGGFGNIPGGVYKFPQGGLFLDNPDIFRNIGVFGGNVTR